MQVKNKKDSLYFQLLKLLLLAVILSVLFFLMINQGGEHLIDRYYTGSDYIAKKNEKNISSLQAFIDKNRLTTQDTGRINEWIDKQKILSVRLYKENILIYDSDYPNLNNIFEEGIQADYYGWDIYYKLEFQDEEVNAYISGVYEIQFYNYALIFELLISFCLFFFVVFLGIRKKLNYVRRLSEDIEILEGGNLNYEETVSGNDELAILAQSLDNMRKSFQEQIKKETNLMETNQKIITEMSHDLRTPLTSIMLYIEILRKSGCKDEEQLREYIEKIDKKIYGMKQLAEHIFEYSLITGETNVPLEDPELLKVLFYDLFSETIAYLEQKGFNVCFAAQWPEKYIRINMDYITRIMDNITSNIIKYADNQFVVTIQLVEDSIKGQIGFSFSNAISQNASTQDSNKIGLQSVRNMMKQMDAECRLEEKNGFFEIRILFPICK